MTDSETVLGFYFGILIVVVGSIIGLVLLIDWICKLF